MSDLRRFLEHPLVYRAWQAPWATAKFAPALRRIREARPSRILDLGCGPGTNARTFAGAAYTGVDLEPSYVAWAAARLPGRFVVGDVTRDDTIPEGTFDAVIFNSILHHVDDDGVRRALASAMRRLAPDGTLHVLELVLPPEPGAARWFARKDRGAYARPREAWQALVAEAADVHEARPYGLGVVGWTWWEMLYLRAGHRAAPAAT